MTECLLYGQELADKLYTEWKAAAEEIPEVFLFNLPEEWRSAERLNPELAPHLYHDGFMGPVLKHPLVFGVPYMVQENPRYNYGLHWKLERLEKYTAARDFDQFIYAHERPHRVDALQRIIDEFDPSAAEVWDAANTAWIDSENIFQNEDEWRSIFTSWKGDHQESFMSEDDRTEWAMLPDDQPVTVYRGFSVDGRHEGMSWTTDKVRAKFFAKRRCARNHVPRLAVGRVMKHNCIGYLNGRNESEVVVFPENVDIVRVGEL